MTTFADTVTAEAITVKQGVHTGPSAPNEPSAIDGSVHVYDRTANVTIALEGANGGTLTVNGGLYTPAIHVGSGSTAGSINLYNSDGKASLSLDGGSGDITILNGDIAEEFDLSADVSHIPPGSVVVVSGNDAVSDRFAACDHRVVGVVAGAGRYRPGLVLDHRGPGSPSPRVAVSLVGKAVCRAVAYDRPIEPGDFLVSAAINGTAMRAPDRELPRGCVFGRALGSLAQRSTGQIPVLLGSNR